MQPNPDNAIVPPLELAPEPDRRQTVRTDRLGLWTRALLVFLASCWIAVFAIAVWIDPYEGGEVQLSETHRQLGLPECTFKMLTGWPCPSCGMTSSFALLMRGDLWHSVQANFAGTLLAIIGLVFVPWALVSVWKNRWWGMRSVEPTFIRLTMLFVTVMLMRWGILMLMHYQRS